MEKLKEYLKIAFTKRLLFTLAIFFYFIMPLVYLYFGTNAITYSKGLEFQLWALIFLIAYLIIMIKVLKQKIASLRNGVLKRFVFSFNILASFGIVWCVYFIIEKSFMSSDKFFNYIMTFELLGFILYNLDSTLNATYLQEKEWEFLGKEQARIEHYKTKYKDSEVE